MKKGSAADGNKEYRVAIVGGSLSALGGGAPRAMAEFGATLAGQGCRVTFFVGESRKYPLTVEQFDVGACEVVHSRLWGPSIIGFFPVALWKLCRRIQSFDAIHLNGCWNFNTFLMTRVAWWKKVPCFVTTHGHYSAYHHGRMPKVRKLLYWLMERGNLRVATAIHITADGERETSLRYLSEAQRVIKIQNPVDLKDFQSPPSRREARERLGLEPDRFYLVHLGRLAPQKNAPFLLQALIESRLENTEMVFLGPEEAKILRRIDELLANCSLPVRHIPFVEGRDRCDRWRVQCAGAGGLIFLNPFFPKGCAVIW